MGTWTETLGDVQEIFAESGTRISPAASLSSITRYNDSVVTWQQQTPPGTSIQVQTRLSDGIWRTATNGGPVPGLTLGQNLSTHTIQTRAILMTTDILQTPVLESLGLTINGILYTGLTVEAKLDNEASWTVIEEPGPLPIPLGADMTGRTLQVRTTLTTEDVNTSPVLTRLAYNVKQYSNPRVLFGQRYGNIAGYTRLKDIKAHRNIAYVGGQGEGVDREFEEVGTAGVRRKEVFVDARDITGAVALTERGTQQLVSLSEADTFEFEVLDRQFKYGIDYDLGDFVTVVIDSDNFDDRQILRVRETYERNNVRIEPEFGRPAPSLASDLRRLRERIAGLENE